MDFALRPVGFDALPGWTEDDPTALFAALHACRDHIVSVRPYRTGASGLSSEDLMPLLDAADKFRPANAADARGFFEAECRPFRVEPRDGASGFVTAFYEPDVEVACVPDEIYCCPFYRRPDDLVDLDDSNRPANLDKSYVFGRKTGSGITVYPDRRAIDQGFLKGRGLEIAWAKSKVDVFFAHVQGAARLRFADGGLKRITFAAKAGHPFSAIGKLLVDRGEIPMAEISMQTIRAWLAAHSDQLDEVLWHNRSYIFFREAEVEDARLGPIAAAKVPLIPGRSLAVDRLIHSFGYPFFIHSPSLTRLDQGRPFARLMLALETGSAIVGPARGDIFTGSGGEAGELAGAVRDAADFYILVPKQAASRFG